MSGTLGDTDWDAIRARIEALKTALDHGPGASPAEPDRILQERARELAKPLDSGPIEGQCMNIIEFSLAASVYAMECRFVREVHPLKNLTSLPGIPSFIAGITNIRGHVLALVDLRELLKVPSRGLGELNRILILSDGVMELGILADRILGTRSIPYQDTRPPLQALAGSAAGYIARIHSGGFILDAAKILGDEALVVNDELG